jgi:hypothetical protein
VIAFASVPHFQIRSLIAVNGVELRTFLPIWRVSMSTVQAVLIDVEDRSLRALPFSAFSPTKLTVAPDEIFPSPEVEEEGQLSTVNCQIWTLSDG